MNTVELQINTYRESTEYGKPFGFLVFDSRGNRHQYGLHQWASVCCPGWHYAGEVTP